jgi:pSer/pThr/pTyr-binding forkhead associated (FHA) protein
MGTYLEIWGPAGAALHPLEAERVSVGKAAENDVSLPDDATMSRLHAAFERYRAGWCVRDLGSTNGTFVNGERVWAERPLRAGDEIRLGATRIVYRGGDDGPDGMATVTTEAPPELTRRERDVLLALCRPVLSGDVFTEPASTAQIAADLVVSDAAVKQHLARLYDKFDIHESGGERRRVRLANEAIRRGAVALTDLRD